MTNVALRPFHVLSLCSGIGGLDLGVRLALGGRCRTVGYVEREAYAAAVLVARMEEAALDPAPVWDDLSTFDGQAWRGRVDIITGGYPCQPFSLAGSRRGEQDERHLWPHIQRIIRDVEPTTVFFENVPGHVSLGLEDVVRDLEGLGYRVAATLVRAEEVGAPHRRERVFVLGQLEHAEGERLEQGRTEPGLREWRPTAAAGASSTMEHAADGSGGERRPLSEQGLSSGRESEARPLIGHRPAPSPEQLADAQRDELRHEPGRSSGPDGSGAGEPGDAGEAMADAHLGRREGVRRGGLPDDGSPRRHDADGRGSRGAREMGHPGGEGLALGEPRPVAGALAPAWPPGPTDADGWRLVPEEAQPAVRRVADGPPLWLGTARADRLRALGNAVVPQQAALAFRILIEELAR